MTASLGTIDGKYELLSVIGSGGFGTVFKARHIQFSRLVAIKVLQAAVVDDENEARFMREAKILSSVQNKSLPVFYGYGTWKSSPYMVMELLDGMDLQRWLRFKDNDDIARKLSIVRQMCDGLACAHQNDVIHRDLKPSNIIVLSGNADSAELNIKVIDFGLARLLPGSALGAQQLTGAGSAVGTAEYMSPEQCRGETLDGRSDIYSAGCILYQCLVGRAPFSGETVVEVMLKHTQERNEELVIRGIDGSEKFSRCLRDVVNTALEKDPADRYQTMTDMQEAIGKLEQLYSELSPDLKSSLSIQTRARSEKEQSNSGVAGIGLAPSMAPAAGHGRRIKILLSLAVFVLAMGTVGYFASPSGIARFASLVLQVGQSSAGSSDPRLFAWCLSAANRSVVTEEKRMLLRNLYAAAITAHVPFELFVEIASSRLRTLEPGDAEANSIVKKTEFQLDHGYPEAVKDRAQWMKLATARVKFYREFDKENSRPLIRDIYFLATQYFDAQDVQQGTYWVDECVKAARREREPAICMHCHVMNAENALAKRDSNSAVYNLRKALSGFAFADWSEHTNVQAMALTLAVIDRLGFRGVLVPQLKVAQEELLEHAAIDKSNVSLFVGCVLLTYTDILLDERAACTNHLEAALKLVSENPQLLQNTVGTRMMLANVECRLISAFFQWGLDEDADRLFTRLMRSDDAQLRCIAQYSYGRCLLEHGVGDEALVHLQAACDLASEYGSRMAPPDTDKLLAMARLLAANKDQVANLLTGIVVTDASRQTAIREAHRNVGLTPPRGLRMTVLADQVTSYQREQEMYASMACAIAKNRKLSNGAFADMLVSLCAPQDPLTEPDHDARQTKRKQADAELRERLVKQIAEGMSRYDIAREFVCSREFTRRLVWGFYKNILGRLPSDLEMDYWVNDTHVNKHTIMEVRRFFLATGEGLNRCNSLGEPFSDYVYRVLTDGKPSPLQAARLDRLNKRRLGADRSDPKH